ncbi:52K [Odocoileus adenovirus 1]|uniref:52K n=2 Tax=Deer atadenovirus A TaxID=2169706 RepID=A0A515MFS1_9ADEN|nr:52K [Odocoileus adenovirus 1]QDM55318.1 52K [Deer atadenovirus A]ASU50472.1 52K [Odocoileus adenovirus 1]ASU50499.1 52K [Odocoileus adenovirus 1]ASU50526.1 52K [Odocoileus adenovirus 1]ASU50553.1 52K [Odocoileus adenovirus 1]
MQMHPILQNFRSSLDSSEHDNNSPGSVNNADSEVNQNAINVGIASINDEEASLRRNQRDDRLPKAKIPITDIFHDEEPKMAEERDLMYNASKYIKIDTQKKLNPESFKPDFPSSNAAARHIEAAELYRNGCHTRDLEKWTYDTFISHVKQLICRPNISLGLTYLDDFIQTYIELNNHSELMYQLIAILNHITEPTLKRLISNIAQKDKKGALTQQWLIDLITCLYLIFRDEQTVSEKLSALLTVSNHLALYFAKKASGGFYPTADKLAKTHIYFKRIILALLVLADNISAYKVNTASHRTLKRSKITLEPSDESYMFSLKGALEAPESDEEEEWTNQ